MLLLLPLLCSNILTWFLVRQGKQRLAVVQRLQDSLRAAEPSAEAGEETSGIPEADYELIARLERGQIMLDRQRSIQAAGKEDAAESFVVQRSHRLAADLADLDAISRAKVERLILRVTADPEPPAAILDEESGLYRLADEDAPYAVVYQVDREASRVRIFGVEAAGDSVSTAESR